MSNLENIVNSSNNNGKHENWLARKLNNPNKGLVGKILDYASGLAATTAAYSFIGTPALVSAAISTAADFIGNYMAKKKTPSAKTRDTLWLSAIWSPVVTAAFKWMDLTIDSSTLYGKVKRGLTQILGLPLAITPISFTSDYLVRHKTLNVKKAYERQVKPFWLARFKDMLTYGSIPKMITAFTIKDTYLKMYADQTINLAVGSTIGQKHIQKLDPYKMGYNTSYAPGYA